MSTSPPPGRLVDFFKEAEAQSEEERQRPDVSEVVRVSMKTKHSKRLVELRGRVSFLVCRKHLFTHHGVWGAGDLSLVDLSIAGHLYLSRMEVFVEQEGDGLIFRHKIGSKHCSDDPYCQGHPSIQCEQNDGEKGRCKEPAGYLIEFRSSSKSTKSSPAQD